MRQPRLIGQGPSIYHCIAEALPGLDPFDDRDKLGFVQNLKRMERFTGVEVLTYSIIDRRIRLLLRIPKPGDISDRELNARLRDYYPKALADERIAELGKLKRAKRPADYQLRRQAYTGRMFELGSFIKTLLQMLTQSYNPRHQWKGTIFRERFRSILIEPWEEAVFNTAAYIELDCVREGLAERPRDYRFCGFGAATKGNKTARAQVMRLGDYSSMPIIDWRAFSALYRGRMQPQEPISARDVKAELNKRSPKLPLPVLLHCNVRYFDHGTVLGRPEFIEEVFRNNQHIFPAKRRKLCYKMRFGEWRGLHSMRNPTSGLITVPKHYKQIG